MSAFLDKVKQALDNLTTLEIKTVIVEDDAAAKQICSTVNLLGGDIENSIHKAFVDDMASIRKFHESQVEKGHEIVEKNIESLKALMTMVTDFKLDE